MYYNYHKHSHISNILTPDTPFKNEDYAKRAVELGHNSIFTTEHGFGGDVFECFPIANKYGLKCYFGCEGYIVPDIKDEKDSSNYHIFISPKTNLARKKLNKIISKANRLYYYYKPRFNIDDLLSLDWDSFILTTACVAGIVRDDNGINKIFIPLLEHFKENMFLEVQSHNDFVQIEHNKKIVSLSDKYNCKLISANDSHYIYESDKNVRRSFLDGKGIKYSDEDSFILDYPDEDELINRYLIQGVLSKEQISESIYNTIIFENCEPASIDKKIKMPSCYKNFSKEEKFNKLCDISYKNFEKIKKDDNINPNDYDKYKEKLDKCLKIVKDTSEVDTEDYFLLDYHIVKKAVEEYGGVITRTGRGSGGAFYLNRVLGLTQLDSFTTSLPIYPERFMSVERILENRSLPDIDLNVVSQEPFVKASKDILGEFGCIPMIAYGTMQISESFRNTCRSLGIKFDEFNEVAKDIDKYRNTKKWGDIILKAETLVDTIISASIHPCSFVLFDGDIEEEIGCIKTKTGVCAIITSSEADDWKYLKNDYLIVTVWGIISEVFNEIGRPIMSLKEIRESVDDKTWEIYSKGLTSTVNQVDTEWGTQLSKKYKPKSIDEVAKLTAAIRPSFDSWRNTFISREKYSNNSEAMDKLLEKTDHYILFQENLMQYFEWLGVTPAESIGLIKKISKKKIKEEDFKNLENRIKNNWIKKTGSEEGFYRNWEMIQDCMAYSFNCISGKTKFLRSQNGRYTPTVEEMYMIMNSRKYAVENGHLNLYKKYRRYGYGYAMSMFDDKKVRPNKIYGIKQAGIKKVYKVITESGNSIICTDNHKFPTPDGKKMIKDIGVGGIVYSIGDYEKTCFDSSLTDNRRTKKYEKGIPVFEDKVISIEYCGEEMVYDVSMNDPVHNFVVNTGIVTANSPHALGYGYDSVYGAYLKSHYPFEYYKVVLNIYQNDQETTSRLVEEMKYFGINLSGIKFGKSSDIYMADKESNTIYKGLASIKYMNKKASLELYDLRNNKYDNFIDLLYDISDKTTLDKTQLEILIKLDFFKDFGNSRTLLRINDFFNKFKKGKSKQIAIDSINDNILTDILKRNSRQTEKTYMDINCNKILYEIEEYIKSLELEDIPIAEKIQTQKEYLGYIDIATNRAEDRTKLMILGITKLKRKSDNKTWGYKLDTMSIGSGKVSNLTIFSSLFDKKQIMCYDIIMINVNMLEKKINNGFINWYLKDYKIL